MDSNTEVSIPYMLDHDKRALDTFVSQYPGAKGCIEDLLITPEIMSTKNLEVLEFIHHEMANGSISAIEFMKSYIRVLQYKLFANKNGQASN